jgi:hypothetical protein
LILKLVAGFGRKFATRHGGAMTPPEIEVLLAEPETNWANDAGRSGKCANLDSLRVFVPFALD